MNNKTIKLGTVNMDWHFAKGKFSCNCVNTEDMNAFDRVICGILYKSDDRLLLKSEIASIIGFNIIDNPQKNRYCDCSENAIFEDAVLSLVEYGLVQEEDNCLVLTERGITAFETRKKLRKEDMNVELWVDEISGASFNNNMFKGQSIQSVEYDTDPDWNLLNRDPKGVLKVQKEINAEKMIKSMYPFGIEYFVANIECEVCYNLETQTMSVLYESEDILYESEAKSINDILLNNDLLQTRLLDKFFDNKKVSVIRKQTYQEEIENHILNLELNDVDYTETIACKETFKSELNYNLNENHVSILYLSLRKLTDEIKDFLRGLSCDMICVDYVHGNFEEIDSDNALVVDKNVCYFQVDELRTLDLCVYDQTYYMVRPYVVQYKGKQYSIPFVYKYEEDKYNYDVLFAPYAHFIFEQAISFVRKGVSLINESRFPQTVKKVVNLFITIESYNLPNVNPQVEEKSQKFHKLKERMLTNWWNSLLDRLNEIESEIVSISDQNQINMQNQINIREKIEQIKTDINTSSVSECSVEKRISEVEKRLEPFKIELTIKDQTNYILDTNIFMDYPQILDKFNLANDKVVIPRAMEQELDRLSHIPDKKENAVKALVSLNRKRRDNPQFLLINDNVKIELLPVGFDPDKLDNHIIATAIELDKLDNVKKVVIVTNDNELINNIEDCITNGTLNEQVEIINLDELLIRLSE